MLPLPSVGPLGEAPGQSHSVNVIEIGQGDGTDINQLIEWTSGTPRDALSEHLPVACTKKKKKSAIQPAVTR